MRPAAKGHIRVGRPPVYIIRQRHCRTCGAWFAYKKYPKGPHRKFCKQSCAAKAGRERRRKVPDCFATMYDLYWEQKLSLWQIARQFQTDHSTVRRRLIQLGIPRRKIRHASQSICIIEDCSLPCYKVKHATNGSMYGRRCLAHWAAHRNKLRVEYWLAISRWRKMGVGNGGANIEEVVQDAVPKDLHWEIREEVCQELVLQLLLRKTAYSKLKETARILAKGFVREYQDKFRTLSLDAPIGNSQGETTTWADVLAG